MSPPDGRGAPPRLLDAEAVDRALTRLAHEIGERHLGDLDRMVVAGIRNGGVPVARELATYLRRVWQRDLPLVALDVSGFRDDRPRQPGLRGAWGPLQPPAGATGAARRVPSPEGRIVLLVDDVIQTGRTMRAAFDLVSSRGRPAAIEMAVLVDRGGREVPVRPNHVGKNLPVAAADWIDIRVSPTDGGSGVYLVPRP